MFVAHCPESVVPDVAEPIGPALQHLRLPIANGYVDLAVVPDADPDAFRPQLHDYRITRFPRTTSELAQPGDTSFMRTSGDLFPYPTPEGPSRLQRLGAKIGAVLSLKRPAKELPPEADVVSVADEKRYHGILQAEAREKYAGREMMILLTRPGGYDQTAYLPPRPQTSNPTHS